MLIQNLGVALSVTLHRRSKGLASASPLPLPLPQYDTLQLPPAPLRSMLSFTKTFGFREWRHSPWLVQWRLRTAAWPSVATIHVVFSAAWRFSAPSLLLLPCAACTRSFASMTTPSTLVLSCGWVVFPLIENGLELGRLAEFKVNGTRLIPLKSRPLRLPALEHDR